MATFQNENPVIFDVKNDDIDDFIEYNDDDNEVEEFITAQEVFVVNKSY
jgi:hypothetical protein